MRFIGLALAFPFVQGAAALNRRADNTTSSNPIARSFIIEYAPVSYPLPIRYFSLLSTCIAETDIYLQGQANRRDGLAAAEGIRIVKAFNSPIFSGASIETDSYGMDKLQALPDVLRVWPNERAYLGPVEPTVLDGFPASFNYTTHNITGVSKLHDAGILGKGVKVGIVDSGTWLVLLGFSLPLGFIMGPM